MYVRYKKNIQENDLPRKRVRKASKIAGSGGQDLEIRYPERGRKRSAFTALTRFSLNLEIRYPERGRKLGTDVVAKMSRALDYLEIRYPERGRKHISTCQHSRCIYLEIRYPERGRKRLASKVLLPQYPFYLEIRYPERGRKLILFIFMPALLL